MGHSGYSGHWAPHHGEEGTARQALRHGEAPESEYPGQSLSRTGELISAGLSFVILNKEAYFNGEQNRSIQIEAP